MRFLPRGKIMLSKKLPGNWGLWHQLQKAFNENKKTGSNGSEMNGNPAEARVVKLNSNVDRNSNLACERVALHNQSINLQEQAN